MSAPKARSYRVWVSLAYFLVSALLLLPPLFGQFGNFVEPRVLGVPWSISYVLGIVAANFVMLAFLYRFRVADAEEISEREVDGGVGGELDDA